MSVGVTFGIGGLYGWGVYGQAIRDGLVARGLGEPTQLGEAPTYHQHHGLVLYGFGEGLQLGRGDVWGTREVAIGFLESPDLIDPHAVAAHNARFDVTVCGSSWMTEQLTAKGVRGCVTVLQGVPAMPIVPRSDRWRDRWVVFSGGQLCYRKGQDIVVAAFRELLTREPDALLVTAWQGMWDFATESITRSPYTTGRPVRDGQTLDIVSWCEANSIPRRNVVDLGWVAREDWPQIFADVDVAVFPNRAEGGTNLVAMEALAAGVLTGVADRTGQVDLVGWAAPVADTDDIAAWANYMREPYGMGDSDFIESGWSWPNRIAELFAVVGLDAIKEAA